MKTLINKLKVLLRNKENLDLCSLRCEAEMLFDKYNFVIEREMNKGNLEIEGADVFEGLRATFKRLYPMYPRDPFSHLAIVLAEDLDFEDYYPKVDDDIEDVQHKIINCIANRVKNGPEDCGGDEYFMLLKNQPVLKISDDDASMVINYLRNITISIVHYIETNKPRGWHWKADLKAFSFFVFTHMVEITWNTAIGNAAFVQFDFNKVFEFYEPVVPDSIQNNVYASYRKLEDIIYEVTNLIETNNWYTMDYEAWLRTVLFNIGLQGFKFALEQKNE